MLTVSDKGDLKKTDEGRNGSAVLETIKKYSFLMKPLFVAEATVRYIIVLYTRVHIVYTSLIALYTHNYSVQCVRPTFLKPISASFVKVISN